MIKSLQKLGFSKEEARLYCVCLEIGISPISTIAKKASTKRQTCLYTIKKLVELGYVSSIIKNGIVYYIPENPQILMEQVKSKVILTEKVIPELLAITNTIYTKPKIRLYQDSNLEIILTQEVGDAQYICALTNLDYSINHCYEKLRSKRLERLHSSVYTKIICCFTLLVKDFLKKEPIPQGDEYRFFQPFQLPIENDMIILPNKVIILSLPTTEPYIMVVENKEFSHTQKTMFDLLWAQGKTLEESDCFLLSQISG